MDSSDKVVNVEGFPDEIRRVAFSFYGRKMRRHDNDRDMLGLLLQPQLLTHFQSVAVRKHNIQQEKIRMNGINRFPELLNFLEAADFQMLFTQYVFNHLPDFPVIFKHDYLFVHDLNVPYLRIAYASCLTKKQR